MEREPCTYGSGGFRKAKERPEFCIVGVWQNWGDHQCTRKRGKGPDGLYCTQHANRIQKREDDEIQWKKDHDERKAAWQLDKEHGKLLKGDDVFLHAMKSMAADLYNAEFGRLRRGEVAPVACQWIDELVQQELDDARLVRVRPGG